jgi:hypothetical protein
MVDMPESARPRTLTARVLILAVLGTLAASFFAVVSPLAGTAAHASSIGGSITRSEVIARARDWLDKNVQYSQTSYHTDPSHSKTYRQDCSGFVSMAWHLSSSRTTWTLPDVSTKISKSNLMAGDILDDPNDHTAIFEKWIDKSAGTFWVIEEANPTDDMLHYKWSLSSHTGYGAYRYNKIVNDHTAGHPNTYAPTTVCGAGYYYIGLHNLGYATIYLSWNGSTKKNCVVTLAHNAYGSKSMGTHLAVQGGTSGSDTGSYVSYAGPVRKDAASSCVKWGGSYQSSSWTSAWSHCG